MAKINFVTNPGDIKKILGKDRAILLLAIDLEGISLDELKHWLTSLTGGEENTAYKKFCASMNLQPQEKKNRDLFDRLARIPITSVQGFRTEGRNRLVFNEAGIHTLADLCSQRLNDIVEIYRKSPIRGQQQLGKRTLDNLRRFAQEHGVSLPE